jgi:3-oxoacyl-[acyl-carrier protein] reductase
MTEKLPETVRAEYLRVHPAAASASPEDVAAVVAFLVSEEAGYVNGQTSLWTGGLFAH